MAAEHFEPAHPMEEEGHHMYTEEMRGEGGYHDGPRFEGQGREEEQHDLHAQDQVEQEHHLQQEMMHEAPSLEEVIPPVLKDPTVMNPAASADHKAERYYNAGCLCGPRKVVRFSDGSVWREQELYIKAIELNPSFAQAYHNLAVSLGHNDRVDMLGVEWDSVRLYIRAIELSPTFVPPYVNLAGLLAPEERVIIGHGSAQDRCALLLQAIHMDPGCAAAYMHLAAALPPGSSVQLHPNGPFVSGPSLVATAQHLDARFAPVAMHGMGTMSTPRRLPQLSATGSARLSPASLPRPQTLFGAPLPSLLGSTSAVPTKLFSSRPAGQPAQTLGVPAAAAGRHFPTPARSTPLTLNLDQALHEGGAGGEAAQELPRTGGVLNE